MTAPNRPPREIDCKDRAIRDLLAGRKYTIDGNQREDKWQKKHVAVVIDLASKFHAHASLKKADLDARRALYRLLAARIRSPERLAQEPAS